MGKKLWSLSGLSGETGRNFRTVAKALEFVKPDGRNAAGKPLWRMATCIGALDAHTRRTGKVPTRAVPERYDAKLEGQIAEIEHSGKALDEFLVRLRGAATVEDRRRLVEREGKCVGAHERALQATVGDGDHAFTNQLYVDHMMDLILRELRALCEWTVADLAA
jgi:hypothetical protein